MKNKNSIAVVGTITGVLLVAAVGISFAYFITGVTYTGAGASTSVSTSTIGNVTLTVGSSSSSDKVEYPGGYMVASAIVTARDDNVNENYDVTYQLNAQIVNNTYTALEWEIREVSSSVSVPVLGCELSSLGTDLEQYYYYTNCEVSSTITNGTLVGSGTATARNTTPIAIIGENLATTDSGTNTYYYLVVHYPNNESNQSNDIGQSITATITGISDESYS